MTRYKVPREIEKFFLLFIEIEKVFILKLDSDLTGQITQLVRKYLYIKMFSFYTWHEITNKINI